MLSLQFNISGVSKAPSYCCSEPSPSDCSLASCWSYISHSSLHLRLRSPPRRRSHRRSGPFIISCNPYGWEFDDRRSSNGDDDDEYDQADFVQASLLFSESIGHYRELRYGVREVVSRQTPHKLVPFSTQSRESGLTSNNAIGEAILRRFQNPTIFLKISCDGDFLLPISVGDDAIRRLASASWVATAENYPNEYQLLKNLVLKLGYEVNMVKITERVHSTYFAEVRFSKPGDSASLSVDIRPSDALCIAKTCMAPIYVSKQIVNSDAIRIAYGMIKMHHTKSVYDVALDSPADGPDILFRELDLVKNMKLAVSEERYNDAAIIRDRLLELRTMH